MIDFLLNNAGPSIVLRVKKEILKDITKKEEQALQNEINRFENDEVRRVNMEKVEWLVRCGLYHHIPQLQSEVDFILEHIDSDGICKVDFYENEFRGWGPYAGLQLEHDWRTKLRKVCDITFRALLISEYAGV